ncbi:MAG: hypothetical protein LBO05_13485 [Deltaproteobacteria bacterium]|nr:hypothetical protein [Deltaproteobacteria bacterium]
MSTVNPADTDLFSGNTLNVVLPDGDGINVASEVSGFEVYNFTFDSQAGAGQVGLNLGVAGVITLGDGLGRSSRVGQVSTVGPDGVLVKNQELALIAAAPGNINAAGLTANQASGRHGVLLGYEYDLYVDNAGGGLRARVSFVAPLEENKVLAEAFLGGLGLVVAGADHIVSSGLDSLVGAAGADAFRLDDGRGSLKYKTGSHVRVEGLSASFGLAYGHDFTADFGALSFWTRRAGRRPATPNPRALGRARARAASLKSAPGGLWTSAANISGAMSASTTRLWLVPETGSASPPSTLAWSGRGPGAPSP